MIYDVIIIGAGASGLMCASSLKGRILVLEKNNNIIYHKFFLA